MGSGGVGATGHMAGELFQLMSGLKFTHVPYRGEAMALTDLIGGQVQLLFATVGSSIQYIKAGKVRPLAVATAKRIELLPGAAAAGGFLPGYEASSWNGLTAPKNTPVEIIDRLNREAQHGDGRSRRSRRGSSISAGRRSAARPPISARSSRKTPRSGPR